MTPNITQHICRASFSRAVSNACKLLILSKTQTYCSTIEKHSFSSILLCLPLCSETAWGRLSTETHTDLCAGTL